jgi:hypothetical protein
MIPEKPLASLTAPGLVRGRDAAPAGRRFEVTW